MAEDGFALANAPAEPEPEIPALPVLPTDIPDWHKRSWFSRINDVDIQLESKGFCVLNTGLEKKVRSKARTEIEELKSYGAFERVPNEAHGCLLGPTTSSWTMVLGALDGDLCDPAEDALRHLEDHMVAIGNEVAVGSSMHFGYSLTGRRPMVLHHSALPGERGAPPLRDVSEAEKYLQQANKKKVVMLYYLGPGKATMTLTPRADKKRTLEVTIQEECVVLYRTDVVSLSLATEELVMIAQMDIMAQTKQSVVCRLHEMLPAPEDLQKWYWQRLAALARNEMPSDGVPFHIMSEAMQSFGRGSPPIRVCQFWHDLPSIPTFAGDVPPLEASLLGGQDVITEIQKPPAEKKTPQDWGMKWDMTPYYDEDPKKATDFKMYTRHLSIINRGHNPADDFDIRDFNINTLENMSLDPKHRMVCESVWKCMGATNIDVNGEVEGTHTKGEDVGFYVGISGTSDQYYHFLRREATMGKFSWSNMSSAAMVSRLSYIFGSTGPAIAIDTEDSSGAGAIDTAVNNLRSKRCGPFALASGVSFFTNPFPLIVLCAANLMSKSGRSRVFDESSDGYAKGESVITAFLEPHESETRPEDVLKGPLTGAKMREAVGIRCVIQGCALSAQGASSALGIQSPSGMLHLMDKCAQDAGIPYTYLDAVECDAGGRKLPDTVELGMLISRNGTRDAEAAAVALRTYKSTYGNIGAAGGIVAIAKSSMLLEKGLHGPSIHLRQLMDLSGLPSEDGQAPSRFFMPTESLEAHGPKQHIGVNSFSSTGTNVCMMLRGRVPHQNDDFSPFKVKVTPSGKPLNWWPGGPAKEAKAPLRGYFIIGTWTNWQFSSPLVEEEPGVYGYTMTMGDNSYELFQIWVDEDEEQALHPPNPKDVNFSKVEGPDTVKRDMSWIIDSRAETVRLLNEDQIAALKESGLEKQEYRNVCAYRGSHVPDNQKSWEEMPLMQLNQQDAGKPGDKYRIRLHCRGKYKLVEWSKVTGVHALDVVEEDKFVHKFNIIGDHNYWTFEEMDVDEKDPSSHSKVIHLLKDSSSFQLYRDGNWEQGFFPEKAKGSTSDNIIGPSGDGFGLNWVIEGKLGDKFNVKFRRYVVDGEDRKTVSWEKVGHEQVDFEAIASKHKWHVIGSFTGFSKTVEMEKDEATGNWQVELTIGKTGKEQFQFLLDGNFLSALHPLVNDATMYDDDVRYEGPDDGGTDKYWTIGLHPKDVISKGNHVIVHLEMDGGLPKKVWWEKYDSPNAFREYLAQGTFNTFDRHCRMLGFQPWQSPSKPAKIVGKQPGFVRLGPGETKHQGR